MNGLSDKQTNTTNAKKWDDNEEVVYPQSLLSPFVICAVIVGM